MSVWFTDEKRASFGRKRKCTVKLFVWFNFVPCKYHYQVSKSNLGERGSEDTFHFQQLKVKHKFTLLPPLTCSHYQIAIS